MRCWRGRCGLQTEEADELEADVLNMKGALKDHLADKEAELSELQVRLLVRRLGWVSRCDQSGGVVVGNGISSTCTDV